jgi:hypothetical protein
MVLIITADGDRVFDASLAVPVQSYRAYWYARTGKPDDALSVRVASTARARAFVYASWNGATDVAAREVLAGMAPGDLSRIGLATATGFGTTISATTSLHSLTGVLLLA